LPGDRGGRGHQIEPAGQRGRAGRGGAGGDERRGGGVQVGEPGGGVEPRRQLRDRQRRQPDRGGVADRGGGGDRRDQRHAGGADLPHQQARVDHAEVEPQGREVARPRADRQHRRGRLPQRRELGVARRPPALDRRARPSTARPRARSTPPAAPAPRRRRPSRRRASATTTG
jgi:hypothetical protein